MTASATNLCPDHAIGTIFDVLDRFRERLAETRPTAAVIELRRAIEQWVTAGGAAVGPFVPHRIVVTGEWSLSSRLSQNLVLIRSQNFLPLRFSRGSGRNFGSSVATSVSWDPPLTGASSSLSTLVRQGIDRKRRFHPDHSSR